MALRKISKTRNFGDFKDLENMRLGIDIWAVKNKDEVKKKLMMLLMKDSRTLDELNNVLLGLMNLLTL